jgi:flagellin
MKINHNIQALNAYRNLSQTMNQTSKTLEKLSSGMRINKAADDAAGLAISEKMRSQIRGLDMAERNTLDAVSLIQTAEGALNETHSILQRMRELSVQAANGTLEDQDREAIQKEINQLTYEIDRIADTTQFNQKKLLSGSAEGRPFAEVSSDQIAYDTNGTWNGVVTAEPTEPAKVEIDFGRDVGTLSAATLDGKTFTINDKTYEIDMTDGTGTTAGVSGDNIAVNITGWNDATADDTAVLGNINKLMNSLETAINQNDNQSFTVENDLPEDSGTTSDGNITNGTLTLSTKTAMSPKDVQDLDTRNEVSTNIGSGITFKDPINDTVTSKLIANPDAGTAKPVSITFSEVPKAGDSLKIDGLTINFNSPENPYDNVAGAATIDVTGKDIETVLNEINDIITLAEDDNHVLAVAPVHSVSNNSLILGTTKTDDGNITGATNGLDIELIDGDFEADKGKELNVELQIGANAEETLALTLGVMDAAKLGIASNADYTPMSTAGLNATFGVDVSTPEAASRAITTFDNAISLVSEERSKLGAFQNRLEHTVTNLQTANENLTAAESRIRDTDMAKSMTEFTKNNILNQAGQAMLAQANQLPQGVLQLLK